MCKVCFRPHYLTRLRLSHFFVHTSILFFGFPPFLVSISYYYGFVSCRILFEEKQFLLRIFLYLKLKNEISDKWKINFIHCIIFFDNKIAFYISPSLQRLEDFRPNHNWKLSKHIYNENCMSNYIESRPK